jgi:hypothetical protein
VSGATVTYSLEYVSDVDAAKKATDFSYVTTGWDYEKNKYITESLSNYIPGSSVTVSGGKVTINLGVPKSGGWWMDFSYLIEDGITVTPSDAKAIGDDDASMLNTHDSKYALICMKDENNIAVLVYVDRDVTIKGTHTDYSYTETWNVSLKKGWNYMVWSDNEATKTSTITATTTLPSGFKWYVLERAKPF